MDIMELGAIGELVGGVAVIGSLLYVGLQVRQSNALVSAQVHQEASRRSSELSFFLSEPDRVALALRGSADYSALSEEEKHQLGYYFLGTVNYYETLFYARERGEVDDDLWRSRLWRMKRSFGLGCTDVWQERKLAFGERFRDFIDAEVIPDLEAVRD